MRKILFRTDQFDASNALKSVKSHCLGQGKFPTVKANSMLVLENRIVDGSLLWDAFIYMGKLCTEKEGCVLCGRPIPWSANKYARC